MPRTTILCASTASAIARTSSGVMKSRPSVSACACEARKSASLPRGDTPSCTFNILTTAQASAIPQTGDESNLALWAAVLVLTGGAAVAILPRLKKHEN